MNADPDINNLVALTEQPERQLRVLAVNIVWTLITRSFALGEVIYCLTTSRTGRGLRDRVQ